MPCSSPHPDHRPDLYEPIGRLLWRCKKTNEFVTVKRGKIVYAGPPDLLIGETPSPSLTPSPPYGQHAPGQQPQQQFLVSYGTQMAAPMWVPAQQQVPANWLVGPSTMVMPMAMPMAVPMEEQLPLLSDEELLQLEASAQALSAQQMAQNAQVYPTGTTLQAQPLVGQAVQPSAAPMGAQSEDVWQVACQQGVALSDLTLSAGAVEEWDESSFDVAFAEWEEAMKGFPPACPIEAN